MKKILGIFTFVLLFIPLASFAAAGDPCGFGGAGEGLCNPTAGFAATLPQFIENLLKIFGGAVGFQAILYVVFAGFKMVISQGDSEKLADAKNSLQWTLSGLVLIIISFSLVYAVSEFIGAADVNPDVNNPNNTQVNNPINSPTFAAFTGRILTQFLGVAGVIAMLMIVINGFRYMMAGGNDEQTESAKQGLQWAVIGLCVIALGYVIVVATSKLFE
jgi:hypothetical protein